MNPTFEHLIGQIHAAPQRAVFEFAGAGSLALLWLHSVAGSSRTLLEASDRYAPAALADLLGAAPARFVARETAEAMARAAYRRAAQLSDSAAPAIGLACTAAIATDRTKRGDHGCWVALCDQAGLRAYGLVLTKGARDRAAEEAVVSQLVLRALAEGCGLPDEVPLDLLPGEQVETFASGEPDPVALLLEGRAGQVSVLPDGRRLADAPVRGGLLSGSFNPLHPGHDRLAQAAAALLGQPVGFELPVFNADKPPLERAEIERRLAQFRWRAPVVLSRAPLFVQKAALFPGCTFVVGQDTAARLVEPRYYGGEAERDAALGSVRAHGCRFLVAGRLQGDRFLTLADIALPPSLADLFLELPEQMFRADISSSAIRAQQAAGR
jgi:nicotinamide mononucleotide (NMN) deamidase PncC